MKTLVCAACTHENRPKSFFCAQCGTKLHMDDEPRGKLIRMNGSQQDQRLEVNVDSCLLGRSTTNNIALEEDSVSKEHAKLEFENGDFYILDLESSNGTFLNGKRVHEKTAVKPGDLLRLGSVILKLES